MGYIQGWGYYEDLPGYTTVPIITQGQVIGINHVPIEGYQPPTGANTTQTITQAPLTPPVGTAPVSDATATIKAMLDGFGLGSLGDYVYARGKEGIPTAQILAEVRERPEYKARFPAMAQLSAQGQAIDEAAYIALEQSYQSVFHMGGLPSGFYDDPGDFAKFIAGRVSPAELQQRVQQGVVAAQQAPTEVRSELERLYGVDSGELTAFFLDPDRALPLIQQRFTAAQIAGASQRTGFGSLTATEAERLGSLGISAEAAQQGFGQIMQGAELYNPLPGEGGTSIGRELQLAATFGGDVAAQQTIEQQIGRRKATFAQGGDFAAGAKGISGLGSAATP